MESLKYDFIVLGSGIAGLTFALEAAAHGRVLVICKAALRETNTAYAQGGIAAVLSSADSFEQHMQDTLAAGAGLCDEAAVRFMVERAPESITWLQQQQVNFDNAPDQTIALGLEGGHSRHRIVHVKDHTGLSIQQALGEAACRQPNITVLEHHMGLELLTRTIEQESVCCGVQVLDLKGGNYKTIVTKAVVLATGGSGQVYSHTTNPAIATGDGLAMACRAGASISNMEFFQFHPTALYDPASADTFLISEALRGAGAELILPDGAPFMHRYHPLGSLAPRDVVARAVYEQMQLHQSPCLYLDASHLPDGVVQQKFPSIYNRCKSIGIDAEKELIPVVPAAHYQCGGVQTNPQGQTTIAGLYALGEVACTGVHGANRLASNSLLEGVVFARSAAAHAISIAQIGQAPLPQSTISFLPDAYQDEAVLQVRASLQALMWQYAGIVRTKAGLQLALHELAAMQQELLQLKHFSGAYQETLNLCTIASLVLQAGLCRKQSVGGHYISNNAQLPLYA